MMLDKDQVTEIFEAFVDDDTEGATKLIDKMEPRDIWKLADIGELLSSTCVATLDVMRADGRRR